jgi:hypothetical protein
MFQRAYAWLLHSGIQEPSGGVARYYRTDTARNAPISTEITGYAASALFHLHPLACDTTHDAAVAAARYLTRRAWCAQCATVPFEPGSHHAYFFDIGIITRGLLAAWMSTHETEFAERARGAALSLAFDFMGGGAESAGAFHPIVTLPEKQPVAYEPKRWSRSPGCYQLKAALAWHDIGQEFNDAHAMRLFDAALKEALSTHKNFLPGVDDPEMVMDRLHAYCYFLEALLSVGDRPEAQVALLGGMARVGGLLREISPQFEQSDVCAQLLRVRLIAHRVHGLALDREAAAEEARRAASYQAESEDGRIDGGFWFGRKRGEMLPFVNPVSTIFCMQALSLWREHCENSWRFDLRELI